MVDRDKAVVWAATATGGILAATAVYWALKKALDAYVPYQVGSQMQASCMLLSPCMRCSTLCCNQKLLGNDMLCKQLT
jgi:hypothetical protein